jgi:hypothetical protein
MDDFDRLFDQQRPTLEQTFTHKHDQLRQTTSVFAQSLQNFRAQGWHTHAQLWNIALYINIAAHDLSVLVWHLCCERDVWARKLIARHVMLLLYETAEDVPQLLGKRFRESLVTLGVLNTFTEHLSPVQGAVNTFWRTHAQRLKNVRIAAAAHRDQDGLALFQAIEAVDVAEARDRGLEFGKILNALGPVLQHILTATEAIKAPEITA